MTTDVHEARIAELRQRRIARLRWLAVRAAFLGIGLLLLLVAAAWWLLGTLGGRDVLLGQIASRLPAGSTLTWGRAEGPASGPMVLHDVHFVLPRQRDPDCVPTPEASCEMGEIVFDAARVMLDPHVRPLLGWRLRLERLEVEDARLSLPESDTPFKLPEWPGVLPDIEPPLSLRVDALDIDGLVIDREGVDLLEVRSASGALDARRGVVELRGLAIDSDRGRFTASGEYAPEDDYRTDLAATWVSPGQDGRLGFVARGDLARMTLAVAGDAPGPVEVAAVLGGGGQPRWQLRADLDGFDPALFAAPGEVSTPLSLDLEANGVGGRASLQGSFSRGELQVALLPSRASIDAQVLTMDPLRLQLLDGEATVRGNADFNMPADPVFDFSAVVDGLRWGDVGTVPVRADANLQVEGTVQRWTVGGAATLVRDRLQADVQLDGVGDRDGLTLRSLQARMPGGALDASGRIDWAPSTRWEVDARLAGFDPGYFAPGWDGAIDGQLRSRGSTRTDGGLEATVAIDDLGGSLRGRALDGAGQVAIHGAPGGATSFDGEIGVSVGDSRIDASGRWGGTVDVSARLSPLHLADLLPQASGTLRGDLQLRGPRAAPGITADIVGDAVSVSGIEATTLSLRGELPAAGSNGALVLRAEQLVVAGLAFDSLRADALGNWSALQVDADVAGAGIGTLSLAGQLRRDAGALRGTLESLQLTPDTGPAWSLQSPAGFSWQAGRTTLSRACLASASGGTLCADADWPRSGANVTGNALPLALLGPYLPDRGDGRQWQLRGELALDASVRRAGNGFTGNVQLASASGGLKTSARARTETLSYEDLRLVAEFDAARIDARLDASLFEGDPLTARLQTGWDPASPLSGSLQVHTDALAWMELLSPDLVEPTGELDVRIGLSGTRGAPVLEGQAGLHAFAGELPALGIELVDGNVTLAAQADGTARIDGQVRTAPAGGEPNGALRVDGSLGWQGNDKPLDLRITGTNVLVADSRDLHAVASPDITVHAAAGEPIQVTGSVLIPEARIDLERLDQGVSPSADVVVLDPVEATEGAPTAISLDLALELGEDVTLVGFGLDGSLDGELRVRQRPGREMTASGTLLASGRYSAYGQRLQITRGRLSWSDDPISNPVLDLRAERDLGHLTAGVDVRGRARAPRATVWSNPATSQSEALAYLALGRPISMTSSGERNQLNAASAALSAGGSLVASQLAASIGLDDAGVLQSRALGGSVFGIGKYLSPRLYVSYGVSLLGTGQVLTLKYLLERGFDIEVESSTVENRATLNWRRER